MDLKQSNHHFERVTEALREELREIIAYEVDDPRVDGLEVVDVVTDPSLKQAHVNVVAHGAASLEEGLAALEKAKGFVKTKLAERLDFRRVPELYFNCAVDLGPAKRVDSLRRRIRRGRPRG